jgi:protein TonB
MATPPSIDGPALADASLGAIEAALNGLSGGADFGGSKMSYETGGRLGATGKGGPLEAKGEGGFSLSEIDQKPRCVFQASPVYPAEMRGRKFTGAVIVLFIVDAAGKVTSQRVEKSSHQAFDRPAMEAVKQWRFEPGVKGGQRVACRMRVSIRFEQS